MFATSVDDECDSTVFTAELRSHFAMLTPFSRSHSAIDSSATNGGSKITGNKREAIAGARMRVKLLTRQLAPAICSLTWAEGSSFRGWCKTVDQP